MTIDEILKLGAMGYTKEDIEALDEGKKEPEKEEPEKKEPEKQEPEKKEPEKQEPEKKDNPQDILQFMAGEFEKLNKSIQKAYILGSDIGTEQKKTADEVLADLVAPPQKKGGK